MNAHPYPDSNSDIGEYDIHDEKDELSSLATYSSGWERSSTSEYLESTDTEDDDYDAYPNEKEIVQPPPQKKFGKIFDFQYECPLVLLPNPYTKQYKQEIPSIEIPDVAPVEPKIVVSTPWKKIEGTPQEDCWKFLEKPRPPPNKERERERRPPPSHHREERKKQQTRSAIDNSNTNKLCKYKGECRMNKNNNCTMVHSLTEWKPRVCRFNNACKRKNVCGYYHTDTPTGEYLRVMIRTADTIYAKNAPMYEKYL